MVNKQERFMNPYTDFGFKKLFGTEPNKDILLSFLNAVFQGRRSTIVDLHYLNTEMLGPYYGSRNSVFDVYCSTQDGGHFIVEMQRSDKPYFKDRTVYYASAAIVHQAPKGDWNYRLEEVCVIGILNFVFPDNEHEGNSYFHEVKLKDQEDSHVVYDKLAFYYIEMPKFNKKEDELVTMLDKWLYVVKNICYLTEQPKELREQVITKFFEEARIGLFTPEEQFAYEESRKHYWDNLSSIAYSYEKGEKAGIVKGIAEGEARAIKATARKMLSAGMSKEAIMEMTGWPEEILDS